MNIEISSFFTTGGCYDNEKSFIFLEARRTGKLCVNFHSVAVKDKSYSIRLLAKFEFPAQASNEIRFNSLNRSNRAKVMEVQITRIIIFLEAIHVKAFIERCYYLIRNFKTNKESLSINRMHEPRYREILSLQFPSEDRIEEYLVFHENCS